MSMKLEFDCQSPDSFLRAALRRPGLWSSGYLLATPGIGGSRREGIVWMILKLITLWGKASEKPKQ